MSFSILGRRFRANHAPPALGEWLRTFWHYPDHAPAWHSYRIELDVVSGAPPAPAGEWTRKDVQVPGRNLRFLNAGSTWDMADGCAGLRASFDRAVTQILLWGLQRSGEPSSLYLGLSVALSEALRISGLLPLHAAVATRGDATVAWLGPSGTGKSITLLLAARAGWHAVAEDLCWLEPEGLRVYGWDRGVRAWPEALERLFPGLMDTAAMPDGKRFIPYDRISAAQPRSCTLTQLVLLGRPIAGPSRRERATPRDVVRSLWEATGVPLSDRSREIAARCVAHLARRVPATRLIRGETERPLTDAGLGPTGLD